VDQQQLVRKVIEVLEGRRLTYMLVGSLASGVYGEPRLTLDIDVVVALPATEVHSLCAEFPAPDFYVSEAAAQQAVSQGGQFNIIHPASGNKIDLMLARQDAWGQSQLARRRRQQIFPDLAGFVASPEDVIIGKMWYYHEGGSEKHLRDMAAMLRVADLAIDRAYIEHWSRELGLTDVWQALLVRLDGPG